MTAHPTPKIMIASVLLIALATVPGNASAQPECPVGTVNFVPESCDPCELPTLDGLSEPSCCLYDIQTDLVQLPEECLPPCEPQNPSISSAPECEPTCRITEPTLLGHEEECCIVNGTGRNLQSDSECEPVCEEPGFTSISSSGPNECDPCEEQNGSEPSTNSDACEPPECNGENGTSVTSDDKRICPPSTDVPFFPGATSLLLGSAGAMGAVVLAMRRRSA